MLSKRRMYTQYSFFFHKIKHEHNFMHTTNKLPEHAHLKPFTAAVHNRSFMKGESLYLIQTCTAKSDKEALSQRQITAIFYP